MIPDVDAECNERSTHEADQQLSDQCEYFRHEMSSIARLAAYSGMRRLTATAM